MIASLDVLAREAMLFAGVGFLIGGLDDLAIDLLYLAGLLRRGRPTRDIPQTLDAFPKRDIARHFAVFVAAWDEATVIGAMLETALARYDYPAYRIYVGAYPNDPATIDAVASIAARDDRVRLVIGAENGPTTKAGCLNTLWRALLRADTRDGRQTDAIILHDAEDVVHPGELRVFDALLDAHAVVQLPVLPLVDRRSRLVSGHYLDEFAESHAKQLIVRQALGAGLPLAGVGCAVSRVMIEQIAAARGGLPFDAGSLTEDYEMGLAIARLGGSGVLARVRERPGGPLVAVRAYFPATLDAAVRQKARWMVGIALAGWDRLGWSRLLDWREHWMRMRDRRAPLAVLVLLAAYGGLVAWGLSLAGHGALGTDPPQLTPIVTALLSLNGGLLLWRLAMRALFTGRAYGPVEAALSLPRAFVSNLVALLAARRALVCYVGMLRGAPPRWDKTAHSFPDDVAREPA